VRGLLLEEEAVMSDWDSSYGDDEDDKTISLDDLESLENEQEHHIDVPVDEDDWGDSFDDLDSEAWERQYGLEDGDDEIERDPWELG
jgi:hypothetical protein